MSIFEICPELALQVTAVKDLTRILDERHAKYTLCKSYFDNLHSLQRCDKQSSNLPTWILEIIKLLDIKKLI